MPIAATRTVASVAATMARGRGRLACGCGRRERVCGCVRLLSIDMIDWSATFSSSAQPNAPLPEGELRRQVALLAQPLQAEELAELADKVGAPPESLRTTNPVAQYGFPDELLDLYRWCDGGDFAVGERRFEPLLRLSEIREYLVTYGVIHWAPGCIPIGMDGGACFYLLDLGARPGPCVLFGGMNELDDPRYVKRLSDGLLALFADPRAAIDVTSG